MDYMVRLNNCANGKKADIAISTMETDKTIVEDLAIKEAVRITGFTTGWYGNSIEEMKLENYHVLTWKSKSTSGVISKQKIILNSLIYNRYLDSRYYNKKLEVRIATISDFEEHKQVEYLGWFSWH